jgi:hypothetical protein
MLEFLSHTFQHPGAALSQYPDVFSPAGKLCLQWLHIAQGTRTSQCLQDLPVVDMKTVERDLRLGLFYKAMKAFRVEYKYRIDGWKHLKHNVNILIELVGQFSISIPDDFFAIIRETAIRMIKNSFQMGESITLNLQPIEEPENNWLLQLRKNNFYKQVLLAAVEDLRNTYTAHFSNFNSPFPFKFSESVEEYATKLNVGLRESLHVPVIKFASNQIRFLIKKQDWNLVQHMLEFTEAKVAFGSCGKVLQAVIYKNFAPGRQ